MGFTEEAKFHYQWVRYPRRKEEPRDRTEYQRSYRLTANGRKARTDAQRRWRQDKKFCEREVTRLIDEANRKEFGV